MEKIYRKVKEFNSLPKKEGYYNTDFGYEKFEPENNVNKEWWKENIVWWLEEVPMPPNEEIEKLADIYSKEVYPGIGSSQSEQNWLTNKRDLLITGFIEGYRQSLQVNKMDEK